MSAHPGAGEALAGSSVTPFRLSKQFSLLAVVVAYLLIEAALWTAGSAQQWLILIDVCWIVCCTLLQRRSACELGIGARGFRQSSWVPLAAFAVVATVIAIAHYFGAMQIPPAHFHFRHHPWRISGYALWAFEQEFILQSFIFVNLEQVLGTRKAIAASTLLFASAHIPNPLLTVCTFFGGLLFTLVFARYRNLWTVGIVHALLGLTIAIMLPSNVTHRMRVGLGYLHCPVTSSHTVGVAGRR